jgi:hypothetical protein
VQGIIKNEELGILNFKWKGLLNTFSFSFMLTRKTPEVTFKIQNLEKSAVLYRF